MPRERPRGLREMPLKGFVLLTMKNKELSSYVASISE
jgi:hypothetical protein